jgi:hypothetical protein
MHNCCLNRPFDDRLQDRVRLEAAAVEAILGSVRAGRWQWVGSDALDFENGLNPDDEVLALVSALAQYQSHKVQADLSVRAGELRALGFGYFDAYHIAAAEAGRCAVMLTTDDRLAKKASRLASLLEVSVRNPVDWLLKEQPR